MTGDHDSLNQILVRIPTVHTSQLSHRACTVDNLTSLEDLNMSISNQISTPWHPRARNIYLDPLRPPSLQHLLNRMLRNETQILRSRLHLSGLGFEFLARLMQVQLLLPENEGVSARALRIMRVGEQRCGGDDRIAYRSVPLDVKTWCFMPRRFV